MNALYITLGGEASAVISMELAGRRTLKANGVVCGGTGGHLRARTGRPAGMK
jgi:hypothetical protein